MKKSTSVKLFLILCLFSIFSAANGEVPDPPQFGYGAKCDYVNGRITYCYIPSTSGGSNNGTTIGIEGNGPIGSLPGSGLGNGSGFGGGNGIGSGVGGLGNIPGGTGPGSLHNNLERDLRNMNNSFRGIFRDMENISNNAVNNVIAAANNPVRLAEASRIAEEAINNANREVSALERANSLKPEKEKYLTFKTPVGTKEWRDLRKMREKQIYTRRWLEGQDGDQLEYKGAREILIGYADLMISGADESYYGKDNAQGDHLLKNAGQALDLVVDFIPGASLVKDALSISTGFNPITGDKVTELEKAFMIGSIFVPSFLSGMGKGMAKVPKILGRLQHLGGNRGKNAGYLMDVLKRADDLLQEWKDKIPCLKLSFFDKFLHYTGIVAISYACVSSTPGDLTAAAAESIGKNADEILTNAQKYGIRTPQGTKVYERIHDAVKSLPKNLKVQRIREGSDPGKIAVIGRSMGDPRRGLVGVNDVAEHFGKKDIGVETFSDLNAWEKFKQTVMDYRAKVGDESAMLPPSEVMKTELYHSNKRWAQNLKDNGYTVLDMGDPNEISEFSSFYAIEKLILFN